MVRIELIRKKIESVLLEKGQSQRWLASHLGISSPFMSQLLSGKRRLSLRMAQHILMGLQKLKGLGDSTFDDFFEQV